MSGKVNWPVKVYNIRRLATLPKRCMGRIWISASRCRQTFREEGLLSGALYIYRKLSHKIFVLQIIRYVVGTIYHNACYAMHSASGGSLFLGAPRSRQNFHIYCVPRKPALGMTTMEEQAYIEYHAREMFTGMGEMVDLGCFVGSSTIPMAKGLEANAKQAVRNKKVHAYDRFVWEEWMDSSEEWLAGLYLPQECFLDEFERQTARWKKRIQVYAGDILQIGWKGAPIEFLFVDAMKSWELANFILREFFSALIPGISYVVHQDFAHYRTPWIHLIMYRLREFFESAEHVPNSPSHVFRYCQRATVDMLNTSFSFDSFRPDEIDSAFHYSLGLAPVEVRGNVAAAKVMCFIQQGDFDRARCEYEASLAQGLPWHCDLQFVRPYLR